MHWRSKESVVASVAVRAPKGFLMRDVVCPSYITVPDTSSDTHYGDQEEEEDVGSAVPPTTLADPRSFLFFVF